MRQWIVHVLRAHLVQGRIPDGVLFREQVCQELRKERTAMMLAAKHLPNANGLQINLLKNTLKHSGLKEIHSRLKLYSTIYY